MRSLPAADPGIPDARSPFRYLRWVARKQAGPLLIGITYAAAVVAREALVPVTMGKGIDAITAKDMSALITWGAVLFGLGVVQAVTGILRHRMAVYNWLTAAYRTVQVTVRQSTRLGATLPKRMSTGEVVSVGNSDIAHIGNAVDILLRGIGAIVAIVTVTVIMISTSLPLGLMVLIGVPLMAAAVAPAAQAAAQASARLPRPAGRPVHPRRRHRRGPARAARHRRRAGLRRPLHRGVPEGTARGRAGGLGRVDAGGRADPAAGPADRGGDLARRDASRWTGQITAGQLVSFYGYAVFLIAPLRTLTEAADKLTKGHVAARRVIRILSLEPEVQGGSGSSGGGLLRDVASGVDGPARRVHRRRGGRARGGHRDRRPARPLQRRRRGLRRRAAGHPADRRGPPPDPGRRQRRQAVRRACSGTSWTSPATASAEDIADALYTACAEDIVEALPDGLDGHVAEAGREFSGGQQQRLRLARALTADPEVLILVEPTSAVDAHSEARIAERLAKARAGRTTLVCTTSPLVLDRTDHVIYVRDGVVHAEGTHRELLATEPAYAAVVTRGADA